MASIDICYAVAAYNLVSEELRRFALNVDIRCRACADNVKNRVFFPFATLGAHR